MKELRFATIFALALFCLIAFAVPPQGSSKNSTPNIKSEKYTLSNGLQVILHVDRKLPIVHVNQWFHVGSANEKPGRSGFAHLFEHMMFQGSVNAPREFFQHAEEAGASGSQSMNGTTNQDRTNYFTAFPSSSLEYLLWMESDRVATLPEALSQEKLALQQKVVNNERRQSYENQAYGRSYRLICENLYPKGHPYHSDVIGSPEDIQAATLEDIREFFRTYYTPNNLSLVVAGDFEPAQAKILIEKYFGSIPPGLPLDRPAKFIPTMAEHKVVESTDRVPLTQTYLAWHTPAYFDSGDAELDLVTTILTDGLSSRLRKALQRDRQLAASVYAYQTSQPLSSRYVISAIANAGVTSEEIEKALLAEIARLAKEGPTQKELERAKSKWEYEFVLGLERVGGNGGKADTLNRYNTFLGSPDKFIEDTERYRRATVKDVRLAVEKYLHTKNHLTVNIRPEQSGKPSSTSIDRSKKPLLGADRPFSAPEVKSVKLANGLEVFVVERPELPFVSVQLASRAGSIADPVGKEGLSYLTSRVMLRGTKKRKALEITDALGDLGTGLSVGASTFGGVDKELASLKLDVLSRNLAPAIALMSDSVLNPSFDSNEFELQKKQNLDALTQVATNPDFISDRVGFMLVFGREHPYGRSLYGRPSSVETIKREDVIQFHRQFWRPGSSALVFVGDITLAKATELAEQHFGKWSGGAAPKIEVPEAKPFDTSKIYLIDRQGAAQSTISHNMLVPARGSDEYYALTMADAVLGGGVEVSFSSRLNLNLREDKGYAYFAMSYTAQFAKSGAWFAFGGVQTNKSKESLVEFIKEQNNISGQKPVSQIELDMVRSTKIRGYAMQFDSQKNIASRIATLWTAGVPFSDMQEFPSRLMKIRPEDVNAIGAKFGTLRNTAILIVGDLAKIRPAIEELKLGEIVILDGEGRVVKGN